MLTCPLTPPACFLLGLFPNADHPHPRLLQTLEELLVEELHILGLAHEPAICPLAA